MHPAAGGAERTIQEVGPRLVGMGHKVRLIASGWRGATSTDRIGGMEITRYPGNVPTHLAQMTALAARRSTYTVIDDLAHVVPWGSELLSNASGTAFFRHLHARTLPGQVGKPLQVILGVVERSYPALYEEYPFVVESASSRADLVRMGIGPGRVTMIPPGVDSNVFHPGQRTSIPQLIYFAGLKPYKQPELAVELLHRLQMSGIQANLVITGTGPSLSLVRERVRMRGLTDRVSFLGRVDIGQLSSVVRQSWVNLHFAVAEGWSYSITEAAASAVPTVAFAAPGVVDSVVAGVTGLLAPPGDVDSFVRALTRVLLDNESFGKRAFDHARQRSWDDCARDWSTHLESLG